MSTRIWMAAMAACGLVAISAGGASAAEVKAWSPHKVASFLQAKHFKVGDVRRKGATYVVMADGAKGNKCRFVIDGRTGKVLGMDVVKWAPGARRVKRGSHGVDFFDEFYEFGVTIPAATYTAWVDYSPAQWTVTTEEYIETTYEEVTYEEVTYEESVTEVTEEVAEEETVETTETTTEETTTETTTEESSSTEDSSSSESNGGDDSGDEPH